MFCKNCGKELSPDVRFCENCGMGVGQGMNYCASCGAALLPGSVVCAQCGLATGNPVFTPVQEETPKSRGGNGLAIVGLICSIVNLEFLGMLVIPGVIAIICSGIALGKKKGSRGLGITGLVLGIVGVVIGIALLVLISYLVAESIQGKDPFVSSYYR